MAHYADGTPAKVGDLIVNRQGWNKNSETILIVIGIQPQKIDFNLPPTAVIKAAVKKLSADLAKIL